MPFTKTTVVMSRLEFVTLANQPGANMRQLCRNFKISPTTGYKWLNRYGLDGKEGLKDLSRRPHSSPNRTCAEVEDAIMELHLRYPYWGPRKLIPLLPAHIQAPAPSTISKIITRNGSSVLVDHQPKGPYKRFERNTPNSLWQMDHKGDFALSAGGRCFPLSVIDDHSRYSIALEAVGSTRTQPTQSALQACFQRFGLPDGILADNGNPWGCSTSGCRFTVLGVWLLRIGVDLIHGQPYHPQTQGKCERLNRTIQLELLNRTLPWRDLEHCHKHFQQWREQYNHIRPHEALEMKTPATCYRPSNRSMPESLPQIEYLHTDSIRTVKSKGEITFKNHFFYIGRAFSTLPIAVRSTSMESVYDLYFSWKKLGSVDLNRVEKPKYRYNRIIHEHSDYFDR